MAAVLTLTTALANAEAVYKDRTRCLNQNFQPDANFENRATIEQLMEQVRSIPVSEGADKKKRLIVILGLLYPTPKKTAEGKGEKPKNPESVEDYKIAVAEMLKAAAASQAAVSQPPIERAKQIQRELSIILLVFDFFEADRDFIDSAMQEIRIFDSLATDSEEPPFEIPEIFALYVLCKFKLRREVGSQEPINFCDVGSLSDKAYNKILSLLDHPNPQVKSFARNIYLAKKSAEEFNADYDIQRIKTFRRYVHGLLARNSRYKEITARICPEFVKYCNTITAAELERRKGILNVVPIKLDEFHKSFDLAQFIQRYEKLYKEYLQVQELLHPSKKEALSKKYNTRLGNCFLPGTPKKDAFPTPDELLKHWKESKKPPRKISLTIDEHKKRVKGDKGKAIADSQRDKQVQKKAQDAENKESDASDSYVKKILRSHKPIVYDERVKDWQTYRAETPGGFTPDEALWKHAFTTMVDPFVGTAYSFKDVWENPKTGNEDPCYCILADVTFPSGETVQGVFQYTFDAKGVCYHRWFGKMSNIERLDKAITEKRHKINFPPLVRAKSPSVEEVDKIQFEIDPYFGSITFDDKANGLKIKIYKVED